jgi:hypothetical protein
MAREITHFEFIKLAIEAGKAASKAKGKEYKGLHTVYSGFNEEFRALFCPEETDADVRKVAPIQAVKELVEEGKIEQHYAFGGAIIYLKGEMPKLKDKVTKAGVMAKYGLMPPPVILPKTRKSNVSAT